MLPRPRGRWARGLLREYFRGVNRDVENCACLQPLPREVFNKCLRFRVCKHAFDLSGKVVSQLAGGGEPRQLVVRKRTPKRNDSRAARLYSSIRAERFAGEGRFEPPRWKRNRGEDRIATIACAIPFSTWYRAANMFSRPVPPVAKALLLCRPTEGLGSKSAQHFPGVLPCAPGDRWAECHACTVFRSREGVPIAFDPGDPRIAR